MTRANAIAAGVTAGLLIALSFAAAALQPAAPDASAAPHAAFRPVQTGAAPATGAATRGFTGPLGPMHRVLVRDLAPVPADAAPGPAAIPGRLPYSPVAQPYTLPSSAASAPQSAPVTLTPSFDGLDDTDNAGPGAPPDIQLAVGPDRLIEMTNVTGRVFTRDGATVTTFALRDFFGVPDGMDETDPKVIYDAASGRFFAAMVAIGTFESHGYLAVSESSDPAGGWCFNHLTAGGILPLPDYPGIGVTDDKFTLSVNHFDLLDRTVGEQTTVMEKSDWLSCQDEPETVHLDVRPPPWGTTRPAQNLSSGGDQYLAEFDWQEAFELCIDRITGTPRAHNVARSTSCAPVAGQLSPPPAPQRGGAEMLAPSDNRVLEAVWRDGIFWVSSDGACRPAAGDMRSCLHLVQVGTAEMTVLDDIVWGDPQQSRFYPALRTDADQNLRVVFGYSGPNDYGSIAVTGRAASDPPGTLRPPLLVKEGQQYYDPRPDESPERWGDYFGASTDPSDPSAVWVAAEYAKADGGVGWGTWIARVAADQGPSPSPTLISTPSPTPVGTPSPPPSASPAPTPTGAGGGPAQGDVDCDGDVDSVDGLKALRHVAGLPVTQDQPCPSIGGPALTGALPAIWADVDCDGDVDAVDGLKILRHVAGLPVTQPDGCRLIGS